MTDAARNRSTLLKVAVLLLALAVYVGGYYLSVRQTYQPMVNRHGTMYGPYVSYAWGNNGVAYSLFAPMHAVDRAIRSDHWQQRETVASEP